jgi:hypothetical protein
MFMLLLAPVLLQVFLQLLALLHVTGVLAHALV